MLALGFAFLIVGCSSIPKFTPSKPVEEASSLNEAIDLCAAYQIHGEESSSGVAKPTRVVTLVPWMRCFENIFRKFPAAKNHEGFVMFFRALQAKYDGAPTPSAEIIDWPTVNFVVSRVAFHLKDSSLAYSEQELSALGQQFPSFWIWLSDSGGFEKPPKAGKVRSYQLDSLKSEIEGQAKGRRKGVTPLDADDHQNLPPRPLPLDGEQKEYCKKYLNYRALVYNVEQLGEYKRVLEASIYKDVANTNEQTMLRRVEKRFSGMKEEATKLRRELDQQFATIQNKSQWFKNGYCLQGQNRLKANSKS